MFDYDFLPSVAAPTNCCFFLVFYRTIGPTSQQNGLDLQQILVVSSFYDILVFDADPRMKLTSGINFHSVDCVQIQGECFFVVLLTLRSFADNSVIFVSALSTALDFAAPEDNSGE